MALNDAKSGGFRFYSLGIVVNDKTEGSDEIVVTPIEDFTMELGELSSTDRKKSATMSDSSGVAKTANVEGGSTVKAQWVPLSDPNRDNAPDVYRSETVMLYKYADTQDYYWSTLFREPGLRGRERVRTALSNKDAGGEAYTPETSYWVEIDTKYKHFKIHTSDNDGEPTIYDITINTKEGTVKLEDALGNSILLESVPGHLEVTTENSVTVNTKRYTLNATESVEINTPKYTLNANATAEVNTPDHTLNAEKAETNGALNKINSELVATEGFHLSGGSGSSTGTFVGNFKVQGNIDVDANITAGGSVIDGGGNTNHHSH